MTQETVRTATPTPEMLTVRQAAQRGVLPERALRRLVAQGKIPTVKVGNRHYVNLSVFKRYLAGERIGEA